MACNVKLLFLKVHLVYNEYDFVHNFLWKFLYSYVNGHCKVHHQVFLFLINFHYYCPIPLERLILGGNEIYKGKHIELRYYVH